ncbi:ABC transporter permease subunit [Ancylobacter sp. 6x-1]|uniref:ABC transporter permease subunit n=1 Tax=Ancylobacter crimeensis TaxID=2579147 RepID=A0ABT0DFY7_9HYPH|nr:ABC transporter permease subunit [Ancylobacter crimeensis]MCK0198873.1 ABC transporter permease subunit [Ancylobacter crimeensis]
MTHLSLAEINGYLRQLGEGALITLELFLTSFALAFVMGVFIALATLSRGRIVTAAWRIYASIFMGVPSLLVIFLVYYGGSAMLIGLFGAWGRSIDVSPFGAGVAALSIVYAAYIAELVRGAIDNLPKGQFEAARALALPRGVLWGKVILPQAMRLALPGLVNVWSFMLKETPLVSLAGLQDLVASAKIAAGATKEPFIFFIATALLFIAFSGLTLKLAMRLEKRLDRGQNRDEAPASEVAA